MTATEVGMGNTAGSFHLQHRCNTAGDICHSTHLYANGMYGRTASWVANPHVDPEHLKELLTAAVLQRPPSPMRWNYAPVAV
jgi:hypothetical protein